ncbi:MAG: hypothetical protein JXR55_07265 [Candidatus Fermentibacteraceae bacterium]|nr:hypothetical protein [Candidatus Fermentibacteraceae bacterium]
MRIRAEALMSVLLALPAAVSAGPWYVDLEETMADLPWVVSGEILAEDSGVVAVVVTESFIGDHAAGDTLSLHFWEMGSWMGDALTPGEGFLLIPDDTGSLQVIGTPGRGCWLLRGYFDFNAFWVHPGVLSREELLTLCLGDTLADRTVETEVRFAGGSEFIGLTLQESGESWQTDSPLDCLGGMTLDGWGVIIGGQDAFPWEPEVEIILHTDDGGLLKLSGRVVECSGSVYRVTVYPTGPVILDRRALVEYMTGISVPSPPRIAVEISGAVPGELGLVDDPCFTTGESGWLHLTGIGGQLDVTSLYQTGDSDSRPILGFDAPMTCTRPLYFDFQKLPDGPSGHLATDIIDAMAKGCVTGTVCRVPGEPLARFTLSMPR